MKKVERLILSKLAAGDFLLTLHARNRMNERLVSEFDIICAAQKPKEIRRQSHNDTYLVSGPDDYGKLLSIVVAVSGRILIVTVFYKEEDLK